LHVFGASPDGARLDALLLAIARARRGGGTADESLLRALATDLGLGADPLMLDLAEPWSGPRPSMLSVIPGLDPGIPTELLGMAGSSPAMTSRGRFDLIGTIPKMTR
jgi:hypothetical protein